MKIVFLIVALVLIAGCQTRSISNSGYDHGRDYYGGNSNPLYQGELTDFDVLGVKATNDVSEQDIQNALRASKKELRISEGDSLLVIQSGALIPDNVMVHHLERHFDVSVFSGVPAQDKSDQLSYSKSLRLSAAKAGIPNIMVYWGVLESGTRNLATKNVSWVPLVGWALPDETQLMRIRLKVAFLDVESGQWDIFVPESFDDSAVSSIMGRESSDQDQVIKLKELSYKSAVESFVQRFSSQDHD